MVMINDKDIGKLDKISNNENEWGGKAVTLKKLIKYDFPVPDGIVLHARLCNMYRNVIENVERHVYERRLNIELEKRLEEQGMYPPLIFRSSANIEGDDEICCSGIFGSYICYNKEKYADTAIHVWESIDDRGAIEYLTEHMDIDKLQMGVLIQPICKGEFSGVLQTCNFAENSEDMIIEYVPWRIEAVVDGTENSNVVVLNEEWTAENKAGRMSAVWNQLREYGYKAKSVLGANVEIEFVISDERVYILQARKIKGGYHESGNRLKRDY